MGDAEFLENGVAVPVSVSQQSEVKLQSYALDLMMISRNVRDLAKTASFAHMSELDELHMLAYTNLKQKMQPGQPLAEDPALVIDTFKMISGVMLQTVEVKRKAADTLLKARVLIDSNDRGVDGVDFESDGDGFDGEPVGAQLQEGGVFGGLASSESVDAEAVDDIENPDIAM
ncbi:MAG: hypothetical protein LBD78_04080 [Spirochaetaceae bacterium]|jgi:hypothetical protein|nr:hypothetical protein [Spirochaetaceae bacterium]